MAEQRRKRITIQDIAREAEVDKAVVSQVVNGRSCIHASVEKIKVVRSLINHYDYTPLGSARSLATRRNHQLAFLLSNVTEGLFANPAFGQMFSGVVHACKERGYLCQADFCDFLAAKEIVLPETLRRRNIDGCILTGHISQAAFRKIAQLEIPAVVLAGEYIQDKMPSVSWVSRDEYVRLLDIITSFGHRSIWLEGSNYPTKLANHPAVKEKSLQFKQLSLRENNEILTGEYWARHYLKISPAQRPSLVYGCDQFCCSFLSALAQAGIHCPNDVSVLCSSETEMARCFNPPLTTFSQNYFDMGCRGGAFLIEILEKGISLNESLHMSPNYATKGYFTERASLRHLSH